MNTIPKIYNQINLLMQDLGAVKKDKTNTLQGYKFRGVDQFVNAVHPLLIKHKIVLIPRNTKLTQEMREVVRSSGKAGTDKHVTVEMEYDWISVDDGSKVTVGPFPGEGLDSGDKATNKAMSASLKYMLIETLMVPTEDMAEADLDSPEIFSKTTKTKADKAVEKVAEKITEAIVKNEELKASGNGTAKTTFNQNSTSLKDW